jgi:protein SCO1
MIITKCFRKFYCKTIFFYSRVTSSCLNFGSTRYGFPSIFVLIVLLSPFFGCQKKQALPYYSSLDLSKLTSKDFVTSDNNQLQLELLKNRPSLINLFFTSCPKICPLVMAKIKEIQSITLNSKLDVLFLSLSVDPVNDTSSRLKLYKEEKLKPPAPLSWILLTTPPHQAASFISQELKLGTPEIPDLHSTRLVLIDKEGKIRGYFEAQDENVTKDVVAALSLLISE